MNHFKGNLVSCKVKIDNCKPLNLISVHSPAWPIDHHYLSDVDESVIKLKNNPKLWVTEILWSALVNANIDNDEYWIVGGDFNCSETFDETFSSGNREILDRMNNLGLIECLREYNGKLTPTFKNARDGRIIHQIDHMFVHKSPYEKLEKCFTGDQGIIFEQFISDHLPIISYFRSN